MGEYFYVSHILVKFDENKFKALDESLKNGYISQADYDTRRAQLVSETLAKSYGEPREGYTVEDLYADFSSAMNAAGSTQAKLDAARGAIARCSAGKADPSPYQGGAYKYPSNKSPR